VPEENVFAVGDGDLIISKAFTWSGPVAAIAAVGVAPFGLRICLEMVKDYTAGGGKPILNHQAWVMPWPSRDEDRSLAAPSRGSRRHYLDLHDSKACNRRNVESELCGELMTVQSSRQCRSWVSLTGQETSDRTL